jgi:hypothetical protein
VSGWRGRRRVGERFFILSFVHSLPFDLMYLPHCVSATLCVCLLSEKLLSDGGAEEEGDEASALGGDHRGSSKSKRVHNFQEGYLTVRGLGKAYFAAEWSRFYFTFAGDEFFYYKSKEVFKLDPKKSVKNRPISLSDYVICTMKDEKSGALQIILEPLHEDDNRRTWEFR